MSTRKLRRDDVALEAPVVELETSHESEPREHEPQLETPVGRRFGRYSVGYELAAGGMATVYLASLRGEGGFEKVLALKCIHPHLSKDPRFVRMFTDEARIASQVGHTNVVQIFDFGVEEGTHYLAMEYLSGATFGQLYDALDTIGPNDRRMLLRALVDACEGLHAVHELSDAQGESLHVVHRDVSPQNVFVTFDGIAKLLDFGIARARDQLHRTETGELKGNLPYVSPEQILGREVDRRADLWSLGVMLWETLTGERLFQRKHAGETVFAVANDMIRRVDALDPSIPTELADVVAATLQRDASARPDDARSLGRAIQRAATPLGPWPTQADVAEWLDRLLPAARDSESARIKATRALLDAPQTTIERPRARWLPIVIVAPLLALAGVGASIMRDPPAREVVISASQSAVTEAEADPEPEAEADPEPEAEAESEAEAEPEPEVEVAARMRRRARMRPRMTAMVDGPPGQVSIVTPDGWAEVSWNGRRLGVTPLSTSLPPGNHTLQLRPFGMGPTKRVRVEVASGQPVRRSVRVQ